jgi:hypothetical protein
MLAHEPLSQAFRGLLIDDHDVPVVKLHSLIAQAGRSHWVKKLTEPILRVTRDRRDRSAGPVKTLRDFVPPPRRPPARVG